MTSLADRWEKGQPDGILMHLRDRCMDSLSDCSVVVIREFVNHVVGQFLGPTQQTYSHRLPRLCFRDEDSLHQPH